MNNNSELTIHALAPLLRRKKLSPVELTRFFLERISFLQPSINAYITVTSELAMTQARKAEKEIVRGKYRGTLHGIPIALKDLFHTRGIRTTAGSGLLKRFIPKKNAVVVDRLLESGCVILGKTNMHEFAYGPTNVHSYFGPVRNPWDTGRMSGGSSGGSAAAVISAQALAALGTDTGGSVRIPAAACGCVGFKPTFGRVPMDGVIPLSFTLDHAGPLSRCVMDAAYLFAVMAKASPESSFPRSIEREVGKGIKALRIGIPRQYFFDRLHPEVRRAVLEAVPVFDRLGATVTEMDLRGLEETARIAAEITGDEAVAYHLDRMGKKAGSYTEDVMNRLQLNRNSTAAAYIAALQALGTYRQRLDSALETVDLIMAPTLPVAAPALDQTEVTTGRSREDVRFALLKLTRPGNLSGLPAISLPCGFTSGGLPVGLQLMGRRGDDVTVLRAAFSYESATEWRLRFPAGGIQ
ncbi:MAG TPA: amidase [Acidobacteriota bacterium]|nr:amidase [Acidobacteriota bacterium]